MAKMVAIAIYDGFQLLDATGPAQVFASANAMSGKALYDVKMVADNSGPVRSTGGVEIVAQGMTPQTLRALNSLVISGGDEAAIVAAVRNKPMLRWLTSASKTAKRACSVCSGAFLLAATGQLSGRRVATHWSAAERLTALFPDLTVDPEAIYVTDGKYWTSAGVTTGIDMCLALVEADHGRELAASVAKQLVVYMHRPGHQSQFSTTLGLQSSSHQRLAKLGPWIEARLGSNLVAEDLANFAGMSLRTLHRQLKQELNTTPKRLIESIRLNRARHLLEARKLDLQAVARATGFSGPDQLIRVFGRRLGLTPGAYRHLHGSVTPKGLEMIRAAQ